MMRFLVDNSLSPRMEDALNQAGHDAIHVRNIGMSAATDEVLFDSAADSQRIVVSQDSDFGTLLALRGQSAPSVILFRMRAKSVEATISPLLSNLARIEADLNAGAIVVFEDTRIRIRRLPVIDG